MTAIPDNIRCGDPWDCRCIYWRRLPCEYDPRWQWAVNDPTTEETVRAIDAGLTQRIRGESRAYARFDTQPLPASPAHHRTIAVLFYAGLFYWLIVTLLVMAWMYFR